MRSEGGGYLSHQMISIKIQDLQPKTSNQRSKQYCGTVVLKIVTQA